MLTSLRTRAAAAVQAEQLEVMEETVPMESPGIL
jgi:hypothetical protein